MEIDIVILPPKGLSKAIGGRVLRIGQKLPLTLAVDNKKLFPHISLLHLQATTKKLPFIIKEVRELAAQHRKFYLGFTSGYGVKKYFCIATIKPKQLFSLHQDVVKSISHYRTGTIWLPKKPKNNLQERYFQLYGVGNVLKFFRPHITLGHQKNIEDSAKAVKLVNGFAWKKFLAQRLAVTQVTKDHQVFRVIREFKLK